MKKSAIQSIMTLTFLACAAVLVQNSQADQGIYRWVDEAGHVHYGDQPHTPNDAPVNINHTPGYTFTPGQSSNDSSAVQPVANAPAAPQIINPQDQTTIRDPSSAVVVQIAEAPKPGFGVQFMLDGKPLGLPTTNTSFFVENLDRGAHQIVAATTSADGKILSESAPITIFYMPPSTNHAADNVPRQR